MWKPIVEFNTERSMLDRVDLWLDVKASPMSFGMSDAWRVVDAYFKNGGWWHIDRGEQRQLASEHITHFMERPAGPHGETDY